MDARLPDMQAWFQRQITGIGATPGPWNVEDLIEPSTLRTPAERLSVYQNAYVARLVECLQAEFPAVRHAVGEETFRQFAVAHLSRHPPHSYTLGQLGAEFSETLHSSRPPRDGTEPDFADFLIQLALYERTVSEVFDAEGPERSAGLDVVALSQLSPEDFSARRLEFYPCVRLLELAYPVHEYASAVRVGQTPQPPASREVRLVVHRREYVVRRFELPPWQYAVLQHLVAGETLSTSLESAWKEAPPEDAADPSQTLFSAFAAWAQCALFRRIARCDE